MTRQAERRLSLPRPARARRRGVASAVGAALTRVEARVPGGRPFPIAFWDGSELAATGAPEGPRVLVRSPRALAHLARRPGQLGSHRLRRDRLKGR